MDTKIILLLIMSVISLFLLNEIIKFAIKNMSKLIIFLILSISIYIKFNIDYRVVILFFISVALLRKEISFIARESLKTIFKKQYEYINGSIEKTVIILLLLNEWLFLILANTIGLAYIDNNTQLMFFITYIMILKIIGYINRILLKN